MKKFLVLFLTPIEIMEDWMKKDAGERKSAEDKMKVEWQEWMKKNSKSIVESPAGAGKTKIVTKEGSADARNDVMMWGTVQAQSADEAANLFKNHPHLQIPESSIEIMEINPVMQ